MSSSADLFNDGDIVTLTNNAVNRYLCKRIDIEVIGKLGRVKNLEINDDFVEKCVIIGDLIIFMKYFPLWKTARKIN